MRVILLCGSVSITRLPMETVGHGEVFAPCFLDTSRCRQPVQFLSIIPSRPSMRQTVLGQNLTDATHGGQRVQNGLSLQMSAQGERPARPTVVVTAQSLHDDDVFDFFGGSRRGHDVGLSAIGQGSLRVLQLSLLFGVSVRIGVSPRLPRPVR